MIPEIVQIRLDLCLDCRSQCPEYLAGEIEHANPCASCPVGYWHAFEEPGCPRAVLPPPQPPSSHPPPVFSAQPGTLLKLVIYKISGVAPCGLCNARSAKMNQWGWFGCWLRRKTILEWLAHEAQARGHKVEKARLRELFRAAWKELRSRK